MNAHYKLDGKIYWDHDIFTEAFIYSYETIWEMHKYILKEYGSLDYEDNLCNVTLDFRKDMNKSNNNKFKNFFSTKEAWIEYLGCFCNND